MQCCITNIIFKQNKSLSSESANRIKLKFRRQTRNKKILRIIGTKPARDKNVIRFLHTINSLDKLNKTNSETFWDKKNKVEMMCLERLEKDSFCKKPVVPRLMRNDFCLEI